LSNIKYPLTAVALTETWQTADLNELYNIPGYKFVSQHRSYQIGGGVAFYIDSRFKFKIRSDICLSMSHIECLFLEIIQLGKVNIFIGCVYRQLGTDVSAFNAELVKILITFDNEKKEIILMAGDSNLDLLKCNKHSPTGDFLNNMLSHSLFPTIRHPTRISDKSSTLLDNIIL